MTRRLLIILTLGLLVAPLAPDAQLPANLPQIGILCTDRCLAPPLEAYEEGRKARHSILYISAE